MKKGVYTFRVTDFQGGYITHTTSVEIIGETDKSYKVRFLGFGINGTRPGYETYVRKKAVTVSSAAPVPPKLTGYRLPYKD